jgi:hypothetical protein
VRAGLGKPLRHRSDAALPADLRAGPTRVRLNRSRPRDAHGRLTDGRSALYVPHRLGFGRSFIGKRRCHSQDSADNGRCTENQFPHIRRPTARKMPSSSRDDLIDLARSKSVMFTVAAIYSLCCQYITDDVYFSESCPGLMQALIYFSAR